MDNVNKASTLEEIGFIYKTCEKCSKHEKKEVIKAPRSKHCGQCDRCVPVMDHHCHWTGRCIGWAN